MSFNSEDHLNPEDPLNCAPRSVRSEANLRSNPTLQTGPATSRSDLDEMLQESVRKSLRHSLEPEVVAVPDQPRFRLGVAAAIGVSAIVAFFFSSWFQSLFKEALWFKTTPLNSRSPNFET